MGADVLHLEKAQRRQFWEGHVRAWEQSGLAQAAYCRREGLKVRNFGYWKRRICEGGGEVSFVSLQVRPGIFQESSPACALKVVLGGGQKIEVEEDFDPRTLKRLIHLLEGF